MPDIYGLVRTNLVIKLEFKIVSSRFCMYWRHQYFEFGEKKISLCKCDTVDEIVCFVDQDSILFFQKVRFSHVMGNEKVRQNIGFFMKKRNGKVFFKGVTRHEEILPGRDTKKNSLFVDLWLEMALQITWNDVKAPKKCENNASWSRFCVKICLKCYF